MNLFKLLIFIITGFGITQNSNAGYLYSFSVNGSSSTAINPLSGTQSAADYYAYAGYKPYPAFGTEDKTAFVWLWNETDTDSLSLGIVFDGPGGVGGSGKAFFTLSGLPFGWLWVLQDDYNDFDGGNTDTTPKWRWSNKYGDGGLIGNLENSEWSIDWLANYIAGIDRWYFLSDGAAKHDNAFYISAGDTLTISAKQVVISEPYVWMLLLVGGLAVAIRKHYSQEPQT